MGRYFGYVVVGIAVLVIVLGILGDGSGAIGLICFSIAFALIAWVVLIRPEVTAHRNGLLMRNMLRDTFLPWGVIKSCRVAQTLQIGTRDKVYHGLGVSKSARAASKERRQFRKQPIGPNAGMSRLQFAPENDLGDDETEVNLLAQERVIKSNFSHTEQRIETLVRERSRATEHQSPKVVWDWLPIAGLAVAAACVVLAFVF